jgi:hypothetical protein
MIRARPVPTSTTAENRRILRMMLSPGSLTTVQGLFRLRVRPLSSAAFPSGEMLLRAAC